MLSFITAYKRSLAQIIADENYEIFFMSSAR